MKVDVDRSRVFAARLGVRGVPTFVLVREGQVVDQIVGAVPRGRLVQAIEHVLQR